MTKNREQLIKKILEILSEDEYREKTDKIKEDMLRSFAEDISKNFISSRVSEEDIREEINETMKDYFLLKDEDKEETADIPYDGVNYQVELGNELQMLLREIPVSREWKERIHDIAISFNNYGLYQSILKECIVASMYDICGEETANQVICEATKRTDVFTEKFFNKNYEAENRKIAESLKEKEPKSEDGKVISFSNIDRG